ncbi:MAG TPA: hypothetical protein V6C72_00215, partial [Chroococcales cyanobacterium]
RIKIAIDESLEKDAALDWGALQGKTDREKAGTLAKQLLTVYYLILPSPRSIDYVEHSNMATMNAHIVAVRDALLAAGGLHQVGDPIELSPYETVVIYRNDNLKVVH